MLSTTLGMLSDLTITATPPRDALRTWWCARHTDPDCAIAFGDDAPSDFAALVQRITQDRYLFYLAQTSTGAVVGAMWLHDLVRGLDDTPMAGWLGTYVLSTYRGAHTTQRMWALVRDALEARGVQSVYIASHYANTRAHRVAEQHLGFHRVDVYPGFARFGGQLTDCLIFSMRREDIAEAWTMAYARARQSYVVSQGVADASLVGRKRPLSID
jgi:RimJ/RimL family protein N-acetyltransferase